MLCIHYSPALTYFSLSYHFLKQHLYERAWYAVTETCLAMTIFKDDFKTLFVVMFTFLLFLKVFHWLCQDRVDSMEQSPEIPMSFHVRMVTMIALLVTVDVLMILHAVEEVMTKKPNMMIMFGFEVCQSNVSRLVIRALKRALTSLLLSVIYYSFSIPCSSPT